MSGAAMFVHALAVACAPKKAAVNNTNPTATNTMFDGIVTTAPSAASVIVMTITRRLFASRPTPADVKDPMAYATKTNDANCGLSDNGGAANRNPIALYMLTNALMPRNATAYCAMRIGLPTAGRNRTGVRSGRGSAFGSVTTSTTAATAANIATIPVPARHVPTCPATNRPVMPPNVLPAISMPIADIRFRSAR
ncbi:hypothetical protein GCM10029964_008690 [Kibdelosporangium lantanae]